MLRGTFALFVCCLLSALSGCRMCQSPYDYCGPMFGNRCGEDCLCYERVGSAIQGPSLYEYLPGAAGGEGEMIPGNGGDAEEVMPGPADENGGEENLEPVPEGGRPRAAPRRMNDNARRPQHRTRQG